LRVTGVTGVTGRLAGSLVFAGEVMDALTGEGRP
jgi:hypothetical protein